MLTILLENLRKRGKEYMIIPSAEQQFEIFERWI